MLLSFDPIEQDGAVQIAHMDYAIWSILLSGTGFGVEFPGISIHQLEDGRYRITLHPNDPDEQEWIYEDAAIAVEHFMQLREVHELGFDYEREKGLDKVIA